MISGDWGMLRARGAACSAAARAALHPSAPQQHGTARRALLLTAKIHFTALLTNPLPPWNPTEMKRDGWEGSSSAPLPKSRSIKSWGSD